MSEVNTAKNAAEQMPAVATGKKHPEKVVAAKKKQQRQKQKRPKDYPRRPLSAYNIFFREARAKLLADRQAQGTEAAEKIGFEKLAKTIGKRWKALTEAELGRFKESAQKDTERYRGQMDAYHQNLAIQGRKERDEMLRRQQSEAGAMLQAAASQSAPQQRQGLQQPNVAAFLASLGGLNNSQYQPDIGSLAGSHLLGRLGGGGGNVNLSQPSQPSISAQLSQVLSGGAALPSPSNTSFQQGLQSLLNNAAFNPSPLHTNPYLLGTNPPQQQQQQVLQQQPTQANSRLAALLAQVHANQQREQQQQQQQVANTVSLTPSMQQQLLLRALQLQGGSVAPSARTNNSRLFPF